MSRTNSLFSILLALILTQSGRTDETGWSLREIPFTKRPKPQAATPEEQKEIKRLIKELATVDAPDIRYSTTIMGGRVFGPLPAIDEIGGFTHAPHGLKKSNTLAKLVEFGPKAMPFLLESLTDRTPTKLTIVKPYNSWDGSMDASRELRYNPLNRREARALRGADVDTTQMFKFLGRRVKNDHVKHPEYNVKVGDLCFVALGQITNREYQAARYQMTACTIVNSTAHDPILATAVRSLWTTKNYTSELFDSLVIDLHSRGGDERGSAVDLQIGAATRLLYYFPTEGGPAVAQRLRELDVSQEDLNHAFAEYHLWPDQLIAAVSFSKHAEVRKEVLDVFRRAVEPRVAVAAIPAIDEERDREVLAKLKLFLKTLPAEEVNCEGDGYRLLSAVCKRFPSDAREILKDYVAKGDKQRRTTLCRVLNDKKNAWFAEPLLTPLLRDKRVASEPWEYLYLPTLPWEKSVPRRICDEAAAALANHEKGLSFKVEGKYEDLDRQIGVMVKKLAEQKDR